MSNQKTKSIQSVAAIDDRAVHTILAALRHWNSTNHHPDLSDIASNNGEVEPLDDLEIDALCEQLNGKIYVGSDAGAAEETSPAPAMEEFIAVPSHHFVGEGELPWLIIGRVPGDDDDTGYLVLADTQQLAEETFRHELHEDSGHDEGELEGIAEKFGDDTFFTSTQCLN